MAPAGIIMAFQRTSTGAFEEFQEHYAREDSRFTSHASRIAVAFMEPQLKTVSFAEFGLEGRSPLYRVGAGGVIYKSMRISHC